MAQAAAGTVTKREKRVDCEQCGRVFIHERNKRISKPILLVGTCRRPDAVTDEDVFMSITLSVREEKLNYTPKFWPEYIAEDKNIHIEESRCALSAEFTTAGGDKRSEKRKRARTVFHILDDHLRKHCGGEG